jgi:hypothetical protein
VACHASLSARCAAAHNDVDWTTNGTPSSGKTLAVFADKLSSSTNSDQVNVDKVLIKETLQSTLVFRFSSDEPVVNKSSAMWMIAVRHEPLMHPTRAIQRH